MERLKNPSRIKNAALAGTLAFAGAFLATDCAAPKPDNTVLPTQTAELSLQGIDSIIMSVVQQEGIKPDQAEQDSWNNQYQYDPNTSKKMTTSQQDIETINRTFKVATSLMPKSKNSIFKYYGEVLSKYSTEGNLSYYSADDTTGKARIFLAASVDSSGTLLVNIVSSYQFALDKSNALTMANNLVPIGENVEEMFNHYNLLPASMSIADKQNAMTTFTNQFSLDTRGYGKLSESVIEEYGLFGKNYVNPNSNVDYMTAVYLKDGRNPNSPQWGSDLANILGLPTPTGQQQS